ncbi:MAG: ribosome recycling factor [Anaerolineaceae bacterium]|jgi:ribosome recycling factor|nr:ribosome recycling factor [Anaerolineae bacterium]MDX9830536.1 ribosome recycling factor [Anaerolineae bacterium]NLF10240.1 ribosome recycling factor [Anaerolineaceae bacterium]
MIDDLMEELRGRMTKSVDALQEELLGIRTGRASPALVERLQVEYYGTLTPLNQMASIAVPEPRLLVIRPWDPSALNDIERAIQKSDLGLTPMNDGKLIRLSIPRLTEERRRELVKLVARRVEEGRIAIRNLRRDALKDLQEFEKEKMISEDEFFHAKDQVQELTDQFIARIDEIGKRKEEEVMEI